MIRRGLRPEFSEKLVLVLFGGLKEAHEAKSTGVREHRPSSIFEVHDNPVMFLVIALGAICSQQSPASSHSQMAHPGEAGVESNQEVFRTPIYVLDLSAPQPRCESGWKRKTEVGSAQLDIYYALTVEMILEASPDSLDLRQLWHDPLNPFNSMILTTR